VHIINIGAAISSIKVPDKSGNFDDIVCGYDTVEDWEKNPYYFGVVAGRFANRIANGKFNLDGKEYHLEINNGPNHLHGGLGGGFSTKIWQGEIVQNHLEMKYISIDGENSYPGEVTCVITYQLKDSNELDIGYKATSTKSTPINLTNHSYFNLSGHKSKDIYDHQLFLNCENFTPLDKSCVPTGEIKSVEGTPFDLRSGAILGARIPMVPLADPDEGRPGFDQNYCTNVNSAENEVGFAARLEHKESGRAMECHTDQPGIQVYTANWVDDCKGKDGAIYQPHCAICLETQNYPDAINKKNFPCAILRPFEVYCSTTKFIFMNWNKRIAKN